MIYNSGTSSYFHVFKGKQIEVVSGIITLPSQPRALIDADLIEIFDGFGSIAEIGAAVAKI